MLAQGDIKLLFEVITSGDIIHLDSLLSHHSFSHEELNSGLIHCVRSWTVPSHTLCIESLLSAGAFLHTRDRYGMSLLMLAAKRGVADLVVLLVSKGCDVRERDLKYRTSLHIAAEADGGGDVINVILQQGAKPETQDSSGNSALHISAKCGKLDSLLTLLESGCNGNIENEDGDSPLHLAVKFGRDECIEALLQHGASPTKMNKAEKSACDYATGPRKALLVKYSKEWKKLGKSGSYKAESRISVQSHNAKTSKSEKQLEKDRKEVEDQIELERESREHAESEAKRLSSDLYQATLQLDSLKSALAKLTNSVAFQFLSSIPVQNLSVQSLYDQLQTDLQDFDFEVSVWQAVMEPFYKEVILTLKAELSSLWPEADIETYGSYSAGLHLPSSDLNMMIVNAPGDVLLEFCDLLRTKAYITASNCALKLCVPVLTATVRSGRNEVRVAITQLVQWNTGLQCTQLVRKLVQDTLGLREIVLVLKHLFQWCDFMKPYNCGINSYGIILMTAFYLQNFPSGFMLAETFHQFLQFYAWDFDYEEVIRIRETSGPVHLLPQTESKALNIQDPMSPTRNVGLKTDLPTLIVRVIQTIFQYALKYLQRESVCKCAYSTHVLLHMLQETKSSLY